MASRDRILHRPPDGECKYPGALAGATGESFEVVHLRTEPYSPREVAAIEFVHRFALSDLEEAERMYHDFLRSREIDLPALGNPFVDSLKEARLWKRLPRNTQNEFLASAHREQR